MGKRKKSSRKPPAKAKRGPLPTNFQCLFCNHENTVTVKVEKKHGVGNLSCNTCGVAFQAPINYLTAAVDVYAAWIDACEDEAEASRKLAQHVETAPVPRPIPSYRDNEPSAKRHARTLGGDRDEGGGKYEADGFVVDDEEDDGGDYDDLDDRD